ncbi:NAD(+)/NADH kinase [Amycolatopsis acidiphila]|uniref:NAD kinase n=1 Tax=Amycolatopsis acidiphila TaxID=715473 RepID=A0A558AAI2_9PSEU|nr:NAD(+)/NADH kinase [Amycolatopsis acidiphila]TVT21266.1 NAD(+)/NADH kinase [Amycolatopsis acidiphila]UIJ63772.1 NAD(+)/NADH kinase [Amycolatopsis acidiphila]GHG78499.1 NAD kinase [Amycolatopsis acidiphila]
MKIVGLVVHPSKPVAASVRTIAAYAGAHGLRVLVRQSQAARVPGVEAVPDEEFTEQVDGLISLGGDGTMLGAMRLVVARPVPVLGVNHGNLGFLVEVQPDHLESALDQLRREDFTVEPHSCLDTTEPAKRTAAFNDIVLTRLGRAAVSVDLIVNGRQFGYYKCDALVVATPTGSTAYNYAAGGPVLSPSAPAMVVTPVAPMAGVSRPVVLGPNDEVRLHVTPDSVAVGIDLDGTEAGRLVPGQTLSARLRQDAAKVVRLAAGAHASRSRVKLSLLDLPLRPDQLLELIPEHMRRRLDPPPFE